jgi:hypothetical protein
MQKGKIYPANWQPYVEPRVAPPVLRSWDDLTTREYERVVEWILRSPGEEKAKEGGV